MTSAAVVAIVLLGRVLLKQLVLDGVVVADVMLGREGRPQFIGTQKYDSNYPSYLRNFGFRHIQRQLKILRLISSHGDN